MSIEVQIRIEDIRGYLLSRECFFLDVNLFTKYQDWDKWSEYILDRLGVDKREYEIRGSSLSLFCDIIPDSVIQLDYKLIPRSL